MKDFFIHCVQNNSIIYQGRFHSFAACVEQAVADSISLANANLRKANLTNITLDNAILSGADFTGANLTGANLSEALLQRANFTQTALYNTCLAWSDLQGCNFEDSDFGATNITGCDISGSLFSMLSCFKLDFKDTSKMENCLFKNTEGLLTPMSRAPLVINGLGNTPIIIFEKDIHAGHNKIDERMLIALLKSYLGIGYKRRLA